MKKLIAVMFLVVLMVFLVGVISGITGTSNSYELESKADTGGTSTAIESSSFTQRFISGEQAVSLYDSSTFTGRFGVLFFLPNTTIPLIKPATAYTNNSLNCTVNYTDDDGDKGTVNITWYNDDVYLYSEEFTGINNDSAVNSSLDAGNFSKDEEIICSARAYDGTYYSAWLNSSTLTINDYAPVVTLVSPADDNITKDRTPNFNWTGFDGDNDSLTYDINITCFNSAGGGCYDDNRLIVGFNDSNYTVPIESYLLYLSDNNYYYNWSVRASDDSGVTYGSWSEIRRMDVQANIVMSIPNSTIAFGNMSSTGKDNTTDDSPFPFLIQNDGNAFLNITSNATSLWQSVFSTSRYYKYKADNKSGEEGSFNWGLSDINWTNMTIGAPEMAIVELKWVNTTDSVEVDLYVEVPSVNEGSGNRQSTVYYFGELGE